MTEKIYRTSDQGFAGYLMMKGYFCAEAIPASTADPKRKEFVFIDVEDPKGLEEAYFRYGRETMSARELNEKVRTANRIARSGLSQEDMDKLRNQ